MPEPIPPPTITAELVVMVGERQYRVILEQPRVGPNWQGQASALADRTVGIMDGLMTGTDDA